MNRLLFISLLVVVSTAKEYLIFQAVNQSPDSANHAPYSNILRCDIEGKNCQIIYTKTNPSISFYCGGLTIDEKTNTIYYLENTFISNNNYANSIYSMDINGNNINQIYSGSFGNLPDTLLFLEGRLYFVKNFTLYSCDVTDCAQSSWRIEQDYTGFWDDSFVDQDRGYFYYSTIFPDGFANFYPTTSKAFNITHDWGRLMSFYVDTMAKEVFWLGGDYSINKGNLCALDSKEIYSAGRIAGIAVDQKMLYWVENKNQLMAGDRSNPQLNSLITTVPGNPDYYYWYVCTNWELVSV